MSVPVSAHTYHCHPGSKRVKPDRRRAAGRSVMPDLQKVDLTNSRDQSGFSRPSDITGQQRGETTITYPQNNRILIDIELRRHPSGRRVEDLE